MRKLLTVGLAIPALGLAPRGQSRAQPDWAAVDADVLRVDGDTIQSLAAAR